MLKLDAGSINGKEYKIKVIKDNTIYIKKLKNYLLVLYYLVL